MSKRNSIIYSGIYKITNKANGKIYIGSSKNITYRWRQHLNELCMGTHHNGKLQLDFNKYGIGNFTFEIIEFVSNLDRLLEREQYHINKNNCYSEDVGYNVAIAKKTKIKNNVVTFKYIPKTKLTKMVNNLSIYSIKDATISEKRLKLFNQNYSLTKKWYKDKDNVEVLQKTIYNYYRNIARFKGSKDFYAVTYEEFKPILKYSGIVKSFIDINDIREENRNNVIFAVNLYLNAFLNDALDDNIDNDEFALNKMLEFLYNNCDISKEINVLVLNKRMYDLLNNYKNSF